MPTSKLTFIDLNFRPQTYWPLNERSHVVSAIKCAERRAYVERMIAEVARQSCLTVSCNRA